ncbi:MAG: hypothetical protein ABR909_03655 [Candidatus Bathyarchaeia archaeon]
MPSDRLNRETKEFGCHATRSATGVLNRQSNNNSPMPKTDTYSSATRKTDMTT